MELTQVREISSSVLDEVEKAVVGKREPLELVWLGFLADGHVLLEDYPGLAKTLAVRSFAQALTLRFTRIQFTPDLMPSDVTGSSIWNQRDADFEFRPGPIFTNLLLADEINRAPPKTQAALLEAMQERQVTIEGRTHPLEPPFLVIGTQNPIEYEGTYPLPEAQLDRFLLRTAFGYPDRDAEVEVLARRIERESDDVYAPAARRPRDAARDAGGSRAGPRGRQRPRVLRRRRRRDARVPEHRGRSEPAREPGPAQARPLSGGAARPRLRRPGRRQGDRRSRARAPPRAPAGAVGAARVRGGRRRRGARPRADAARRGRGAARAHVTRRGGPRLLGFAALAALGLLGALALRRPELAVAAAPFALVLVLGTRLARDPTVTAELLLPSERTLEDTEVSADLRVEANRPVDRLELYLELPREIELVEGTAARAIRLRAGEERELPVTLRCTRWGSFRARNDACSARDPFRLVTWEARLGSRQRLKAYPREITLRRLLAPVETQPFVGSEVSRAKGDGIEYADLRDFVPGDRVRTINWRASARRRNLVVNERHAEQNTDVVLFVDSFVDVRGAGRSVLEDAVRVAAALATRYLARRNRVGLVGFGGILRWLQPGLGRPSATT